MREPPRFLGLDWLGLLAAVTLEIPGGGGRPGDLGDGGLWGRADQTPLRSL